MSAVLSLELDAVLTRELDGATGSRLGIESGRCHVVLYERYARCSGEVMRGDASGRKEGESCSRGSSSRANSRNCGKLTVIVPEKREKIKGTRSKSVNCFQRLSSPGPLVLM